MRWGQGQLPEAPPQRGATLRSLALHVAWGTAAPQVLPWPYPRLRPASFPARFSDCRRAGRQTPQGKEGEGAERGWEGGGVPHPHPQPARVPAPGASSLLRPRVPGLAVLQAAPIR